MLNADPIMHCVCAVKQDLTSNQQINKGLFKIKHSEVVFVVGT